MGKIRIDSYPFRRWFEEGTTELPNYSVLKTYLIEQYRVCYFCGREVRMYPHVDGLSKNNDQATIDHLYPRTQGRKRFELSLKVLSCNLCNHTRNEIEQRPKQSNQEEK